MSKVELIKLCSKCGVEFKSETPMRICPTCRGDNRKVGTFEQANENLLNDVAVADQLGISYGKYKGDEGLWKLRLARYGSCYKFN